MVSVRHLETSIRRERLRARHVNPASPAQLLASVEALASFGEKRVGTPAGARAGAYIYDRMLGAGLTEVCFEEFAFPRHDVGGAALVLRSPGGPPWMPGFDVFEGAGAGMVDADIVAAGAATDEELVGVDLRGKVALVERHRFYHRSTQYRNVTRAGAVAMIDISAAPDNLRQVGSVRRGFESMGTIPALTIGADDGERLLALVRAGQPMRAIVELHASSTMATGANVVARVPGREPGLGTIVIGAHYDTWFQGATDNGGGVAALLALAELRAAREMPRYPIVFVAWDGEEVALYGGYDWLRRHSILGGEHVLAVLNFETPSALGGAFNGLAHSGCPCLDGALRAGGLDRLYPGYLPMSDVPKIFGGIIPTDIQGAHRMGIPVASTACDSPYYHTTADTPEKIDADQLARAVLGFDRTLDALLASEPRGPREPHHDLDLWHARVTLAPREPARILVCDAHGVPQPGVPVEAVLLVDDFFLEAEHTLVTDASGVAYVELPSAAESRRWLHVGAGPSYPLCEAIVPL
jgi:Zn-dependent M28 family amino/carboxypeptidase